MIIDDISRSTGIDRNYLIKLAKTASKRYKRYLVQKRGKGKEGQFREILHPSKNLKFIQRWLIRHVFLMLPIHESVFSYRDNISIRDNALHHRGNRYLLRIDFENFFPSLKTKDVSRLLKTTFPTYSSEDYDFIASIVCKDGGLTIGAPSSPILSNALLYEIDCYWAEYAKRQEIVYTRYADDLYFSCDIPDRLAPLMESFKAYIDELDSPKLSINHSKSVFTSKKRKRMVTGLIITPQGTISIGRDRKRMIRVLMHRYVQGSLTAEEVLRLKGLLSFIRSVEPTYIRSLENKYSNAVLQQLL
jgi:RNA-directed DNA polymerase